MGLWRSWERASMAWKRSSVRSRPGPPIFQELADPPRSAWRKFLRCFCRLQAEVRKIPVEKILEYARLNRVERVNAALSRGCLVSRGDLGASVRQRLLNQAKAQSRPFQEVMQYYAFPISARSPHANEFILKGALLLSAWRSPLSRSTTLRGHSPVETRAKIEKAFQQSWSD